MPTVVIFLSLLYLLSNVKDKSHFTLGGRGGGESKFNFIQNESGMYPQLVSGKFKKKIDNLIRVKSKKQIKAF